MNILLPAVLVAASLGAASASAQTIGDSLDSGRLSAAALSQLIAGTGLSADEARGLTLNDIALLRTDSNAD